VRDANANLRLAVTMTMVGMALPQGYPSSRLPAFQPKHRIGIQPHPITASFFCQLETSTPRRGAIISVSSW
jgi:hypothetical protein